MELQKQHYCPECNSKKWETTNYNAVTGVFTKKCRDCGMVAHLDKIFDDDVS